MVQGFLRFKPGVKRRTHLLMSALLWTGIGCMLLTRGGFRLVALSESLSGWQIFIAVLTFLAGSLKAYFILDKSACRTISRILNFKDGTCLGAVYSVKTWILVLCMMGMGVILRNSSLPNSVLCFVSLTIGWALLISSRLVWKAWLKGK